jgi:hypothetical protein
VEWEFTPSWPFFSSRPQVDSVYQHSIDTILEAEGIALR